MSFAKKMAMRPDAWIDELVDAHTFLPLASSPKGEGESSSACQYGPEVVTGLARVNGRPVAVYAIDPEQNAGFVTAKGALKIRRLMDRAEELGIPVVAFLASAGVSIEEGLKSGDAYTQVISRNIRLSGVVPQLACVMSVTMGAPAYSATLMDLVLFNRRRSHMMVTGPAVVSRMLGESPTLAELGGSELHAERTGIADFVDKSPLEQIHTLKALLSFLPDNRIEDAPRQSAREPVEPLPAIPERPDVAFDMTTLLAGLVDGSHWLEVGAGHGQALLTAFAYLGGFPLGIVANQSLVESGAIGADAARKAARFIRICDAYNIPILNLIDVPGFMPGVAEESRGLLRQGAALCMAMDTGVPRLSVVVRKCYGAAAFVMLQTRTQEGDVVLALEGSRIAVMGFDAARHVLYADDTRTEAELRAHYHAEYEAPHNAFREGFIDEVIKPSAMRTRLIAHLAWLGQKRERPNVVRRHAIWP
jgi:acetyl-CoA carboxylase carboxyltransferase component